MLETLAPTVASGRVRQVWFAPLGMVLQLETDSPAILHAAEASFGRFAPLRTEPPAGRADFRLRLFAHGSGATRPAPAPPTLRIRGAIAVQEIGTSARLVVDRAAGLGFGSFATAVISQEAFFRWHFLEFALFWLLEGRGFLGVHGAAVARGGEALLLRAASGQGKTTLAFAAARRGFQALAEDVVWLDTARGLCWGMPWTFHLLPDAPALFPELAGLAPHLEINGEHKLRVDLEALRPGSTAPSARPAGLIFLDRRSAGPSRLVPLDPAACRDEIRDAWQRGAASREDEAPGYEAAAAALLQLPLYRLEVAPDLDSALDLLDPLLPPGAS